jgi:hypothetical protein
MTSWSVLKLLSLGRIMVLLVVLAVALLGQQAEVPFEVSSLFDFGQPLSLGLPCADGAETITIFSPGRNDNKYNHGVVAFPFKGTLFAQWQTSATDDDAGDTHVVYSRSKDGTQWSAPTALTTGAVDGITTSGGWWGKGDTLVA